MRLPAAAAACVLITVPMIALVARTQDRAPPPKRPPEQLARLSVQAEQRGLAEPYRGIVVHGQSEGGLFPLRSTGVPTAAVRQATEAFLAALDGEQRRRTTFTVDDDEWRKWMNQSFYVRQGVSFQEMSETQRQAAFALLRAGLSAKGLRLTQDIMRLNETLAELTDNHDEYGQWQYHLTVMGTPSATEPWGWQLDGHHAVINYFVLGDQVVMTPFFAGSEPVHATSGRFSGTVILQDEQAAGLAMIAALDTAQRQRAILGSAKDRDLNLSEAWHDNLDLDWAGIRADALTAPQRARLLELIGLHVGNLEPGHARVRMEEIRAHLDRTWFAWIGRTEPGSVFYYRIHSPVILIEFDHQQPVALRHLFTPGQPTLEHIHTVVRTPNGNDYGKDLLRQHYAQHPHP